MAVTMTQFTKFKGHLGNAAINLVTDTLKVMLLDNSVAPARDTNDVIGDVSATEVTGTGYTAGGKTLTTPAVVIDAANHRYKLTGDDLTWASSTITARYAILYKSNGAAGVQYVIAYVDFGANVSSSAGDFKITWNATDGVLDLGKSTD